MLRTLLRPFLRRRGGRQPTHRVGVGASTSRPRGGSYRSDAYLPLRSGQVRTRTFTMRRRGADPAEVAAFLDRLANDLDALYAALADSRGEVDRFRLALRDWQSQLARAKHLS
ncbi:DivIVA domain-containing protein [Micromonospora craniellae]|uniref:DivIVA domain-containing protein n=1 Tax=Micromonospora craniellae TaxID=2294034 RepID=UPI001CC67310|nr:DivIVA domain-containing protein [Micromonospora craniellae]